MTTMSQPMQIMTSRTTVECYTPPWVVNLAREVLGTIDLDPASNDVAQQWVQAETYYTKDDVWSGLARPWHGRVWCNPPFDDTQAWVDKLTAEYQAGHVQQAVLLTNSAPGYNWWEELVDQCVTCMLRRRLVFIKPDGTPYGDNAKRGQSVYYFGDDYETFRRVFKPHGRMLYGALETRMPKGGRRIYGKELV